MVLLRIARKAAHRARWARNAVRAMGRRKVFCIGRNKTGTTSVQRALLELGYVVAPQEPAELMIHDWARRDFRRLIRFCRWYEAFQDSPFSLPFTYQAVDMAFPGSKFILTVRDNAEQWYESLTKFHAKLFGGGQLPTIDALKAAHYRYRGFPYDMNRAIHRTPEGDPYQKDILIAHYKAHNDSVVEYFRHRPDDLLVMNVADAGAYARFCEFLDKPCDRETFPWENKTTDKPVRPVSCT